jgi:hypothetical protein
VEWNEFEPTDPEDVPLKLPDVKLVAAFRGECQADFSCLETKSLGALNHTAALRYLFSKTSKSKSDYDYSEPDDGETMWEDRNIDESLSEDEDGFEEESLD